MNKRYSYLNTGQNGVLPFSHKLSSKMPPVWNYLGKHPYFETRFLDNRVIAKWNLKKNVELKFHELKFHNFFLSFISI